MDWSRLADKVSHGFRSGSEQALFFTVMGLALVFVGYLVADAVYHRLKWRRLHRRLWESGADRMGEPPNGK